MRERVITPGSRPGAVTTGTFSVNLAAGGTSLGTIAFANGFNASATSALTLTTPQNISVGSGSTLSTSGSGTITRGGTFNLGVTQPAQDVDPVTMYNEGAIATANIAGEYLCFPNPDYTLDPRLATSWQRIL